MRYELSDYEWTAIKPILPNRPRGVRRVHAGIAIRGRNSRRGQRRVSCRLGKGLVAATKEIAAAILRDARLRRAPQDDVLYAAFYAANS